MKKRILAILLAVLLLLPFAPLALAEEDEEEPGVWEYYYVILINQLTGYSHNREDTRTTLGVGDTIQVFYQGNVPADMYVNDEAVHHFDAGESYDTFDYEVKSTGPLTLVLRTDEKELIHRDFKVISSRDMYSQTLKESVDPKIALEELKDGAMHGFPVGNPFVYPFLIVSAIAGFFIALFSFRNIIK